LVRCMQSGPGHLMFVCSRFCVAMPFEPKHRFCRCKQCLASIQLSWGRPTACLRVAPTGAIMPHQRHAGRRAQSGAPSPSCKCSATRAESRSQNMTITVSVKLHTLLCCRPSMSWYSIRMFQSRPYDDSTSHDDRDLDRTIVACDLDDERMPLPCRLPIRVLVCQVDDAV